MDNKKRSKRSKQDASGDTLNSPTSNEMTGCDLLDGCSSPDFMSSQECFSVGWDWSGHINGHKKPTIRVIERPAQKKTNGVQLLECSRPRRLIRNVDNFDASDFVKELKSLAAGCKGIQETTSPVASPPSFRRKMEVLVTPTSLRESMRKSSCSKSIDSSATVSTSPSSSKENTEETKESLGDLLDDSLGADLLKFTQDLEQGLKQNDFKTPNPQEKELNLLSSAKRRNRLSLTSKKTATTVAKSVCRRINDLYEENLTHTHEPRAKHNNNNNVSSKIEFDDIDEAMMLSIGKLEEQEFVKSKDAVSPEKNAGTSNDVAKVADASPFLEGEDDDFVSPDLLDLIDVWEKKATQECDRNNQESKENKENKLLPVKEQSLINKFSNKSFPPKHEKGIGVCNQPPKKTLCLGKTRTVCTPEEIEKKRQDAKKRLQLKKKCQ